MRTGQLLQAAIRRAADSVKTRREERQCREIAATYDWNGYKRIYLIHIRKTGGTSLNRMFLALGAEDGGALYSRLAEKRPDHRIISNGLIYVGWHIGHINNGYYFYGFSHVPLHQLNLPEGTFTLTCFRDPVERVISHYNMLMHFRLNKIGHPCMASEGPWLGDGFEDFLRKIPREHLLRQLYMFSESFDIVEAVERAGTLSHFFFSDDFDAGVSALNRKADVHLSPLHVRKAAYQARIPDSSRTALRDMLDDEYRFLENLKQQMRSE